MRTDRSCRKYEVRSTKYKVRRPPIRHPGGAPCLRRDSACRQAPIRFANLARWLRTARASTPWTPTTATSAPTEPSSENERVESRTPVKARSDVGFAKRWPAVCTGAVSPPMATTETFRDRGFRFSLAILREYRLISKQSDLPRHIGHQMLRSGTSVGANLAEARSASSRRDLAAKNAIALREARECRFWLRLIQSDQPELEPSVSPLLAECEELIAMLTAAVRRLRSSG